MSDDGKRTIINYPEGTADDLALSRLRDAVVEAAVVRRKTIREWSKGARPLAAVLDANHNIDVAVDALRARTEGRDDDC